MYAKYVEEVSSIDFLELAMDYEKHIKQWFFQVEGISHPEAIHIFKLRTENRVQKLHETP